MKSNITASVVVKYKPENSPKGGKPLVHCLWAIFQLDQRIMSWHGPSFCADSSVTLGDPVKFISAVCPSQLAGLPQSPDWTRDGFYPQQPHGNQDSSLIPAECFWYLTEEKVSRTNPSAHPNNSLGKPAPQTRVFNNYLLSCSSIGEGHPFILTGHHKWRSTK